ncbi:MAG: hypothetical protein QG638_2089 [Pseudomonadota bacterium]|nr:hypothetical protein [Pseudomonadota bacterium]MDQ5942881.1 hypothetical protein [Pseudomonadota bacterium]
MKLKASLITLRVKLKNGCVVHAFISGNMRMQYFCSLPGDKVMVQHSV